MFEDSNGSVSKNRDINKWPLVLNRRFDGTADSCSISKFCTLLISYGVKQHANSVEFFPFVIYNWSSDVTVEVVNHPIKENCMEDEYSSKRLSILYDFLKTKYAITDNPLMLFSKLESNTQGHRGISEYGGEFRKQM
jgi:hypothetical protein